MSIREKVLAAKDIAVTKYEVPEWDVALYIKHLSGKSREEYISASSKTDSDIAKLILMIRTCVCEEDGTQAFTDDDVEALSEKNASVLDRVVKQIMQVNGLGSDAVDDAEKN